jgi:hypothetical protein
VSEILERRGKSGEEYIKYGATRVIFEIAGKIVEKCFPESHAGECIA